MEYAFIQSSDKRKINHLCQRTSYRQMLQAEKKQSIDVLYNFHIQSAAYPKGRQIGNCPWKFQFSRIVYLFLIRQELCFFFCLSLILMNVLSSRYLYTDEEGSLTQKKPKRISAHRLSFRSYDRFTGFLAYGKGFRKKSNDGIST